MKYRKKQYHRFIRFENIASQFTVIATYFFPLNLNASTNDNKKHFPLMISNQQN